MVLVGITGAAAGLISQLGGTGAEDRVADERSCGDRISIAADPKIAPMLTELVDSLPADECRSVGVRAVASAQVAGDVARQEDRGIGGTLPDLWLPDSSIWLDRAAGTAEGADRLIGSPTSLVSSPVVVAVARSKAQELGWPDTALTWRGLLDNSEDQVLVGLTDLQSDAAAMAGAAAADATGGDGLASLAAAVSLPGSVGVSATQMIDDGTADAVPTTEQEVFQAAEGGGTPIIAAYDADLGSLDYPVAVVAPLGVEPSSVVTDLRDQLLAELQTKKGQSLAGESGFRDADGSAGPALLDGSTVDGSVEGGATDHDSEALDAAVAAWPSVSRRSRLLVTMDLSGSMGEQLPGSTQTRDQAAQAGLEALIEGAPPDNEVGLWGFTTAIGNGDYRVFVPAARLADPVAGTTQRASILTAISGLDAVPGGSTSLYDTIEAAYGVATENYAFGKFNAVVVLTDGRNEDPGSVSLRQLVDSLRQQFDGTKPVRVVTIAYGRDADRKTLARIADATGGTSFTALTEADIAETFAALASEE